MDGKRDRIHAALDHLEQTSPKGEALVDGPLQQMLSYSFYHNQDWNDDLVLEDAEPIMRVFVPRLLGNDGPEARDVLNLFTYNLFANEDDDWWRKQLH
jgi:hypothetical protein